MNMLTDRFVLVPACVLCPAFMAAKGKSEFSWRKEILLFLAENGFSILPLPCPESTFVHPKTGLHRLPHNVRYYETLDGFREHCASLAESVGEQLEVLKCNDYIIEAILGLENSPTCAVEKMFIWGEGTVKRPGLFIENLATILQRKGLSIPIIGIDRRNIKKTICRINEIR